MKLGDVLFFVTPNYKDIKNMMKSHGIDRFGNLIYDYDIDKLDKFIISEVAESIRIQNERLYLCTKGQELEVQGTIELEVASIQGLDKYVLYPPDQYKINIDEISLKNLYHAFMDKTYARNFIYNYLRD